MTRLHVLGGETAVPEPFVGGRRYEHRHLERDALSAAKARRRRAA